MPLRSTAAARAQKRWGAAMAMLLLAACLAGPGPAQAGDFVDSAGRRVLLPEPIERVMPANPTAEVLVYVLAPERLVGASRAARRGAAASRHVPVLGWRPGMGPASMAETAAQLRAQLILDAGPVTPERAAFADQVQQLAGIPYILVDDSFVRMPSMLRGIGALLGVTEHGRHLGRYAEDTINMMRGRLLIQAPETRPHVYYGRRADGLETALPGAPEGESIEQAGAINVARVLGRDGLAAITPAQLYEWNPEIIIAEERSYDEIVALMAAHEEKRGARSGNALGDGVRRLRDAMMTDGDEAVIAVFESQPALAGVCPPDGVTMLHRAAGHGSLRVAKWLLDHGADVNKQSQPDF